MLNSDEACVHGWLAISQFLTGFDNYTTMHLSNSGYAQYTEGWPAIGSLFVTNKQQQLAWNQMPRRRWQCTNAFISLFVNYIFSHFICYAKNHWGGVFLKFNYLATI